MQQQVVQVLVTLAPTGEVGYSAQGGNPLMWAGMMAFAQALIAKNIIDPPKVSPLSFPKLDLGNGRQKV